MATSSSWTVVCNFRCGTGTGQRSLGFSCVLIGQSLPQLPRARTDFGLLSAQACAASARRVNNKVESGMQFFHSICTCDFALKLHPCLAFLGSIQELL